MKRCGAVIALRENQVDRYLALHREVWPAVLRRIRTSNIRNYSIYLRKFPDGQHYLFSYFEYVGDDYDSDMAALAADSETHRWWDVCKPCHEPFPDRAEGEWWAEMEEVFHYN